MKKKHSEDKWCLKLSNESIHSFNSMSVKVVNNPFTVIHYGQHFSHSFLLIYHERSQDKEEKKRRKKRDSAVKKHLFYNFNRAFHERNLTFMQIAIGSFVGFFCHLIIVVISFSFDLCCLHKITKRSVHRNE